MTPTTSRLALIVAALATAIQAPVRAQDAADVQLASFDKAWSLVYDTHFDTTFNGVDWRALRSELRPRAIGAPRDTVRRLIADMLGRLGQSHFALFPQEIADASTAPGGDGELGMDVRLLDGQVVVTATDPAGPAHAAGIRPGWLIEAVDSETVGALLVRIRERKARYSDSFRTWAQITGWLQGDVGSTVSVSMRDGSDRPRMLTLTRRQNPGLPVKFGNFPTFFAAMTGREAHTATGLPVGVIAFNTWMVPLTRQVDSAVDALRASRGMILDLRGNTGGVGAMIMGVAGHFTGRRDTLGVFRTRTVTLQMVANPRTVSPDGRPVRPFGGPVAILTDELSGSASEVFAGGMQAIHRVRVFGDTTLGGVLPAIWDRLPNGDVLYHAFAEFVTSDGVVLEGRGVIPDSPVTVTRADLLAGRDPVLDAALRWIADQAARTDGGAR